MKNTNKRNLSKISKRNTHKRRSKERAKEELLKIVAQTNVGIDSLRIRDSLDGGRRDRTSDKHRNDEVEAIGIYSASKCDFGFVSCEGRERDVFIPAGNSRGALDGDTVEIIYHTYRDRFGEEKTEGWEKQDLYSVLPAIYCFLDKIRATLPEARIVWLMNTELKDDITACMKNACAKYGAHCLQLCDIDKDERHPSVLGMKQIKDQIIEFFG